jgi:hypothetical protein
MIMGVRPEIRLIAYPVRCCTHLKDEVLGLGAQPYELFFLLVDTNRLEELSGFLLLTHDFAEGLMVAADEPNARKHMELENIPNLQVREQP